MEWARHVVRVETGQVQSGFWWGEMRETHHLEHLGVDGRIILKWIFKQCDGEGGGGEWTGLIWLCLRRSDGLL